MHANKLCRLGSSALDPVQDFRDCLSSATECKELNEEDHTWDLLQDKGYMHSVGPQKIFMSQTAQFFKDDQQLYDAV